MKILVTVGMSEWPFDRLLSGVIPLCAEHEVFAQTGVSKIEPPCEFRPFIPFDALQDRLIAADLVITHAGNTVRLVQRLGKLPIACAREARFGEMANDHQVPYLRREEAMGRVVAAWDPSTISDLLRKRSGSWMLDKAVPAAAPAKAAQILTEVWRGLGRNPFQARADRAFAFAFDELSGRKGRHGHIGKGGERLRWALASTAPGLTLDLLSCPQPGEDIRTFQSVSMLDHEDTAAAAELLAHASHLLEPEGLLVMACDARLATDDPAAFLNDNDLVPRRWERKDSRLLLSATRRSHAACGVPAPGS
jgi:UDP-N-acetylglucosamine transferase subunit ALG13